MLDILCDNISNSLQTSHHVKSHVLKVMQVMQVLKVKEVQDPKQKSWLNWENLNIFFWIVLY